MSKKDRPLFMQYGPGASVWRNVIRLLRRDDPHKDLGSILEFANPKEPIEERILWLAQLVAWLRGPVVEDLSSDSSTEAAKSRASIARMRFLLRILNRHPEHSAAVSGVLRSILLETDSTSLLTRTSLTEHSGFFTDLARRLLDKVIPPPPRTRELGYVVDMVFTEDRDSVWLEQLTTDEWDSLVALIARPVLPTQGVPLADDPLVRLQDELQEAILQICIQVSAIGLNPEMRERTVQNSSKNSPFVALTRAALLTPSADGRLEFLNRVHQCQIALRHIQKSIEERGVSLTLLYRQETLSSLLKRLIELSLVLNPEASEEETRLAVRELLVEILRSHRERSSVSGLLRMNFDLFAKKLVEHAGETGEHYITRSGDEYKQMYWAGAGGGLITVATTFVKFMIFSLSAPLAIEGFLIWINYSGSFLTMQYFDFALATKQPSMTAATLAGRIERVMPEQEKEEFVNEVVRITRSQLIAAFGNVSIVTLGCFLCCYAYQHLFHRMVLDEHHALKTLQDINPFTSFVILYAAITGVALWLSSLCAGWTQNWVNMRGLAQALSRHPRLVAIFGARRAESFGQIVQHSATGIGANLSVGFFMAFIPILGKFSGLPIDIRHITLSSGSVTVSMMSLGAKSLDWHIWLPAVLGLFCILFFNLSVSFLLALVVATRSRRMPLSWLKSILGDVGRRFRTRPLEFFIPRGKI